MKIVIDDMQRALIRVQASLDNPSHRTTEQDSAEDTNTCTLKSITDQQVNAVVRAFWRRIYAYRNDYGIELPKPLPVEFMAHMATALTWVDKEPDPKSESFQQINSN